MSERAPYSRVYWTIIDDTKFVDVYDNDRVLACWLRLLLIADQAWPASASIPATARKPPLETLVKAGLVDLQPGGRFRIHGLDAERGRRKVAATRLGQGLPPDPDPTGDQTGPNRGPDGPGVPGLSRAEPSLAKPSRAEQGPPGPDTEDKEPDPADAYWTLTGKYPTAKPLGWIDDLTRTYGPMAVIRAVAEAHQADPATASLLGRAQDRLRRDARTLDLRAQGEAQSQIQARRAAPRPVVDEAERQRILRDLMGGAA